MTHRERTQDKLRPIVTRILDQQRAALVKAIHGRSTKLVDTFEKSAADDLKTLIDAVENGALGWDDSIREEIRDLIGAVTAERAESAMQHVSDYVADAEIDALLEQANELAIAWAENRIGNLVTDVSATTRDVINEMTAAVIRDGLTNDEFADLLGESFGFSEERADLIARTETAFAETAGTLAGYKASGVVDEKEWSADDNACDICAGLDGVRVALDDDFPDDGGDGPPQHPRCECSVAPVVSESALSGGGEEEA